MMFTCGGIGYIFVLQSLVLYGLYPYVVEQQDSLIETRTCVGVSVFHCGSRWRCECHIVSEHSVASVVIALVVDCAGLEKQLLRNVVPILACLKGRDQLSTVVVEGDALVGKALAATIAPKTPFVTGMVTQTTAFEKISQAISNRVLWSGSAEYTGVFLHSPDVCCPRTLLRSIAAFARSKYLLCIEKAFVCNSLPLLWCSFL